MPLYVFEDRMWIRLCRTPAGPLVFRRQAIRGGVDGRGVPIRFRLLRTRNRYPSTGPGLVAYRDLRKRRLGTASHRWLTIRSV